MTATPWLKHVQAVQVTALGLTSGIAAPIQYMRPYRPNIVLAQSRSQSQPKGADRIRFSSINKEP